MEVRAIIVATVTIYCGLYYLTNDLAVWGKMTFLALMVLANLYFITFWFYYLFYAGLLVASKFVPFLKENIKDIGESTEKPLQSLIKKKP